MVSTCEVLDDELMVRRTSDYLLRLPARSLSLSLSLSLSVCVCVHFSLSSLSLSLRVCVCVCLCVCGSVWVHWVLLVIFRMSTTLQMYYISSKHWLHTWRWSAGLRSWIFWGERHRLREVRHLPRGWQAHISPLGNPGEHHNNCICHQLLYRHCRQCLQTKIAWIVLPLNTICCSNKFKYVRYQCMRWQVHSCPVVQCCCGSATMWFPASTSCMPTYIS